MGKGLTRLYGSRAEAASENTMALLRDKDAVRALLQADRPWAVYALGDLDPEHFVHARWYAHGRSIVMLYRAFRPPVPPRSMRAGRNALPVTVAKRPPALVAR